MTKTPENTNTEARRKPLFTPPRMLLGAGVLVAFAIGGFVVFGGGSKTTANVTTFPVKRGNLDITVVEGGSVEALQSQEIRSEVRDRQGLKILSIVEEGYLVTPEDVKNGLILVELDSADLKERLTSQEIQTQTAEAQYIQEKNAYEIQASTNESNINAAKLKAKIALMDFQKFLGERAVTDILAKLELDKKAAVIEEQHRNLGKEAESVLSLPPPLITTPGAGDLPPGMAPPTNGGAENGEGGRRGGAERWAQAGGNGGGGPAADGGPRGEWQRRAQAGGADGQPPSDGGPRGNRPRGQGFGDGGPQGGPGNPGGGQGGPGNFGGWQGGAGGPQGFGGGRGGFPGFGGNPGDIPPDDGPPIPVTDELINAVAAAMQEQGMPMDPERFRMMLSRGGDGSVFPPQMVAGMKQVGVDIRAIAEKMASDASSAHSPSQPTVAAASGAPALVLPAVSVDLEYLAKRESIDFTQYAHESVLEDGEAKQKLRALQDELLVADQQYKLAKTQLEGKERLAKSNFVTEQELESERVKQEQSRVKLEASQTALPLYIKYEFPKQAEQLLSAYEEALMQLERTMKEATSKLAQAAAQLRSAESRYRIELGRLNDYKDQLAKCTIRAERPGLVVYGTSTSRGGNPMQRQGGEPIAEGSTVLERQLIIVIPDMTEMSVRVKVHESAVQRVVRGQKARIRVDSKPNLLLTGEVLKVSVMPDAADRWMNPDVKVYATDVKIDGSYEWLRPGMSAQVEILIETLKDVLYVPIQAVTAIGNQKVCYVQTPSGKPERRIVETGQFNAEFIEVVSGLSEGERVLLLPPDYLELRKEQRDAEGSGPEEVPERPA